VTDCQVLAKGSTGLEAEGGEAMKMRTAEAWSWVFGDKGEYLCCWAEPSKMTTGRGRKPSPEAKAIRVRIIPETDYRKLMRAAKQKRKVGK